jgi:hypothetical protein
VVSIAEFASRFLGQNSISARLRPEEYKEVPEPILNDTLNDVHDLIQWAVVHAQRIIYGQDLEKTFAVSSVFLPELGISPMKGSIQLTNL